MTYQRIALKALCSFALVGGLPFADMPAQLLSAEEEGTRRVRRSGGGAAEFDARRKFRAAEQLIEMKEFDRATGALENLVEQYPESKIRFKVWLTLGRYWLKQKHDQKKAIEYFKQVEAIEETLAEDEKLQGDDLDIFLEALYLTGVAHFETKSYDQCFPILRKITTQYPNTIWSNQSYYYIGMAHFVQKNWGKAIKYLSLVGTYVDPEADTAKYVEAGHRLYVKVEDGDLPILSRLKQYEKVEVEAKSGDIGELTLSALSLRENLFIATMSTEVGKPNPDDNVLQIVGGDEITIRYYDANTKEGEVKVLREETVEVVSTASASFTDATYETKAKAAYTGQSIDILVVDVDLDTDEAAQDLKVTVQSRYISANDGSEDELDVFSDDDEEGSSGPNWEVRDEVEIPLSELPNDLDGSIFHTGKFAGKALLTELKQGEQAVAGDNILSCMQQDQLVVTYVDELHINGDFERVVQDTVDVVGPWKDGLSQTNSAVPDPITQSLKAVSEGEAYLALGEIFKSMGLMDGARQNVEEGLTRAEMVIAAEADISDEVRQKAFKLKWELHLAVDDLQAAITTCKLFNAAFPESRFADDALLGIGKIHLEKENYDAAIAVFNQILTLEESDARPEAQFRIAQAIEAQTGFLEPAIPAYQNVAERYPQSLYTGEALAKLVQYHIESNDFVTANNLLTIIFEEHPDKQWLDSMLVRWIILAYRMGDYQLAHQKAQQFTFEYPDSPFAKRVVSIMQKVEKKMKKASADK